MKNIKKRHVTLIEMMIVMFLIAMIIGVVAYNYKGTLDEGKAFKTKAGKEKLITILSLEISDNPDLQGDLSGKWREIVKNSPLVQNPNDLIKDGWGVDYIVETGNDGQLEVSSKKYEEYLKNNPASKFRENKE